MGVISSSSYIIVGGLEWIKHRRLIDIITGVSEASCEKSIAMCHFSDISADAGLP